MTVPPRTTTYASAPDVTAKHALIVTLPIQITCAIAMTCDLARDVLVFVWCRDAAWGAITRHAAIHRYFIFE